MLFEYRKETFSVNWDWLQYSVLLPSPNQPFKCPDGYRLQHYVGNNIFKNRAILFDETGRKWLTLLWEPHSHVIDERLMTVQVSNELLYKGSIVESFELLQLITPCVFNSIGRLDVCLDFQLNGYRSVFLDKLAKHDYYVQRRSQGWVAWHEGRPEDDYPVITHYMTWGSHKSNITIKAYDKSLELGVINGEGGEKPWIVDEWRKAGYDINKVWRLEFSISDFYNFESEGKNITLQRLEEDGFMESLFCKLYHERFVTRVREGKRTREHNDDTRLFLLSLPKLQVELKKKELGSCKENLPDEFKEVVELMKEIQTPKILIKRRLFEAYADTILDMVEFGHLESYFRERYKMEAVDFLRGLESQVGSGIFYCEIQPDTFKDD